MAKRDTGTTKFDGSLSDYKTKYLRCRGRRRHPWKFKGHYQIIEKNGRILQFTEELHCGNNCGVVCVTDYEVTPEGRFQRIGRPHLDYSGAPGYLIDTEAAGFDPDEARDELMTRELMGYLSGDALSALFRTKNIGEPPADRHLRAV